MPSTVDSSTLAAAVKTLTVIAEAPSTPPEVAEEAQDHLLALQDLIPRQPHHWEPGQRGVQGAVEAPDRVITAAAGFLRETATLESTPPTVGEDAERHASALEDALGS